LSASPLEVRDQRNYYERTAEHYDSMHVNPSDEHGKALSAFMALAELAGPVDSVLDIGAGTGRALKRLKERWPAAKTIGIEPVAALRAVGHKKEIPTDELIAGDALNLAFEDDSFDYVIETGVLHHIAEPLVAVREMVRVSKKGVMISDSNNIGQGGAAARAVKFLIKRAGLWPAFIWMQTGGRMYKTSEGDGVFYSFSAYDCVGECRRKFSTVHYMNTTPCAGLNIYRGASHVMIFATKS